MEALEAEQIGYVVIGMAAAAAQGVLANTLDIDLWINLPPRQYMRLINLSRKHGATMGANTVVYLEDGTPVNFVYEMVGLDDFAKERRHAARAKIHGHNVPMLSLERIVVNKKAVGRDKDKLHLLHIRDFLRCRRAAGRKRSLPRKNTLATLQA